MMLDDRRSLEEERDFLCDAIRQLESEHDSGALTDNEYAGLRDQQTVRLADILRELDSPGVTPTAPVLDPKPRRRLHLELTKNQQRLAWVALVLLFAVAGFASLAGETGTRLAGESSTGTVTGDTNSLLAKAQQQTSLGKPADALKTYDAVLKLDPNNAQALAYRGWLIRLAGLSDQGLASIDRAIVAQPAYPDAHFFKGYILFRDKSDPAGAVTEFQTFLANNPPAEMKPLVEQALQDAQAQAAAAPK